MNSLHSVLLAAVCVWVYNDKHVVPVPPVAEKMRRSDSVRVILRYAAFIDTSYHCPRYILAISSMNN